VELKIDITALIEEAIQSGSSGQTKLFEATTGLRSCCIMGRFESLAPIFHGKPPKHRPDRQFSPQIGKSDSEVPAYLSRQYFL